LWLVFINILALLAIWQMQLPLQMKLLLLLLLLIYLIWLVCRHLLALGRHAIKEVRVTGDGIWQLTMGNGDRLQAQLLPDSFVKPWLMVLNFKTALSITPVRHLVLLADSLEKSQARNLRIYLRQSSVNRKRFL
jgi:hypothetical protein